ncbi:MAG: ABC transporter substrate-binding protein [Halanaerobiales bacterium]|nr:ABC transporter substrate-binding protein [Halanaerobiales bacterium]
MKRSLLISFLVTVLVLGLVTVGLAAPKYGGIWKDALQTNPPNLDPVIATDTSSAEMGYQLFETLVENDIEGALAPLLAESWDVSEDALTYTFKLREGVHFHATTEGGTPTANGGREVTAEDWVWTFNYICNPETKSPRAYFIDMIKGYEEFRAGTTDSLSGVKALDKYTLEITLSSPRAYFINVLAYNAFVVLPHEDVEKWGEDWNFHPVGTGAFKFERWDQDSVVVLNRNENYWMKDADGNQLPYLDRLEFWIIPDYVFMWEEFEIGNIYQTFVDDPFYHDAKDKYGEFYMERPQYGTYYYGMNVEKEPFTDVRVRKAMNYAINRETLIEIVMNGRATPAKGVLPPGMFGYNPELTGYSYDPERARELLEEAGYPDGFTVTLQYNSNPGHKRIAEALQAQYAQVGIDLQLRNVDWGTHLDTIARGEADLFRIGWVSDYNDPDNFLYVLLNSENIGDKGNYSRYSNRAFDEWTKQGRLWVDNELRLEVYNKAEELAVDEAPWVFIYHYTTHSLVQPYVRNYFLPAFGQYSNKFRDVWLDK